MSTQKPLASQSKLVILEVDHDTEKEFGWPIDRDRYSDALDQLKKVGHPWVLSFLNFQAVDEEAKNTRLARTISNYKRYIGSGLTALTSDQDEMSDEMLDSFLPRALITTGGKIPEEAPDFELALDESEIFVKAQKNFGMGPRYGTQSVINCASLYFKGFDDGQAYAIPTSMFWASAFFMNRNLSTNFGPRSAMPGMKGVQTVASKNCLSSPNVGTREFFNRRGITSIPFHQVVKGAYKGSLKGKLVVLSHARMRRFQGPGQTDKVGSGIVPEHMLSVRFLDDLIAGQSIHREPLSESKSASWAMIVWAGALAGLSLYLTLGRLIALNMMALVGCVAWSLYQLYYGRNYYIPLPLYVYFTLLITGFLGLWAYLVNYAARKVINFRNRMKQTLIQYQDFPSFVEGTASFLAGSFSGSKIGFSSNFEDLYEAASSPRKVANYIAKQKVEETNSSDKEAVAPIFKVKNMPSSKLSFKINVQTELNILDAESELGAIDMTLAFEKYERAMVVPLLLEFRNEIFEQWARVHRVIETKIADYETLVRNTRSSILEKFLSQTIIDKFQDGRTMEDNLQAVLTPRKANAAVLQADIRGYSGLFADNDPIKIVKMIQGYYDNTVDVAQQVAQVKLIGDCIFLFIEDRDGPVNAVDFALYLSGILIRETNAENERQAKNGTQPVVFGIAIHFGEVIIGNLSSENCIDYTVVGPNVNRTARMEELTKAPKVKEKVGANGVLISTEAVDAMKFTKGVLAPQKLSLDEIGQRIRSFDEIEEIAYVRAEEALRLAEEKLLEGSKKAS